MFFEQTPRIRVGRKILRGGFPRADIFQRFFDHAKRKINLGPGNYQRRDNPKVHAAVSIREMNAAPATSQHEVIGEVGIVTRAERRSKPIINPWPRTFAIRGCRAERSLSPAIKYSPRSSACAARFSSRTISIDRADRRRGNWML